MTLRIAFGRINQETNALSPLRTTLRDFEQLHLSEGEALLQGCLPGGVEAPGFLKSAELSGFIDAGRSLGDVEPIPLLSAWTVPGGPLTKETFDNLLDRLIGRLRAAGRIDGVMLALHGAMGVVGVRDPESVILEAVQDALPGARIASTYDLHGNVTRARIAASDIQVAYSTNPHRDHRATGRRAGELLIRTLRGEIHPTTAWRSLPMLMGGGTTIDLWPPMLPIFARIRWWLAQKRVLSASIYTCHPWNDDPELGWSSVVITDGDRALAESLADELAERLWAVRNAPPPAFPSAEEAIAEVRAAGFARRLGVVVLCDASDVVSAGAPGENTRLLSALLDATDIRSVVPLRDPAVVETLWTLPIGAAVTVSVGGKLDPARNAPLTLSARIRRAQRMPGYERIVVLDAGHLQLVLTEGPAFVIKPQFYEDLGLSVWRSDVVVVKNFFPFRLFFLPMARKTLYVKTSGVTDFDAAHALSFSDAMHPRDHVVDWRPADRRRRGV